MLRSTSSASGSGPQTFKAFVRTSGPVAAAATEALHRAIRLGDVRATRDWLDAGASPHVIYRLKEEDDDVPPVSALSAAAARADASGVLCTAALLAAGADPNVADEGLPSLPLFVACAHASHQTVALLLENGAAPDGSDSDGTTALSYLTENHNSEDEDVKDCLHELWLYGAPMRKLFQHSQSAGWEALTNELSSDVILPDLLALGCFPLPAKADLYTDVFEVAEDNAAGLCGQRSDSARKALLEAVEEASAPGGCPFARLRLLRSREFFAPGAAWWTQREDERDPRLCAVLVDRAARAALLRETAEAAETEAAARTVRVLQQWQFAAAAAAASPPAGDEDFSKRLRSHCRCGARGTSSVDRLAFAAAMCVAKWRELSEAVPPARAADAEAAARVAATLQQSESVQSEIRARWAAAAERQRPKQRGRR